MSPLRRYAIFLLSSTLAAVTAADADPVRVQYKGGKLWLGAHGAPAADVFTAVAKHAHVRFVVDSEVHPGPITIDLEAMPLERAIHNIVAAIPQVAGHSMTYSAVSGGKSRLTQVTLLGPGKGSAGNGSLIYAAPVSGGEPTPSLDDRMDKMIAAGVPRETAEKVIALTREVQKLQATPVPGTYSPNDLSTEARSQLQPLLDRGVAMERAVQMLLLQDRYQQTLKDLAKIPGQGLVLSTPPPQN